MNKTYFLAFAFIFHLTGAIIPTQEQLDAIVADIIETIDNGADPADYLRLAWHDAATFNKSLPIGEQGGNHASMFFDFDPILRPKENDFEGGDLNNAGQDEAMEDLEPVRQKWRTVIGVADLWVLAANTGIENAGGPHIVTRFGRIDASKPEDGIETFDDGPLPSEEQQPDVDNDIDTRAHLELDYLLDFFGKFGFDDTKHGLAALVGGHTFGKCEVENSGLDGPWTPNAKRFDNDFYKILTTTFSDESIFSEEEFDNLDNPPFGTGHQLNALENSTAPGNTLMLYSDIAILRDPQMAQLAQMYANDQDLWFKDFTKYWGELMELAWPDQLEEATASENANAKSTKSTTVDGPSLGIGFAIGFVVMALGAMLYCCCCQKKKSEGGNYAQMDDEPQRKTSELVGISGK